MQEIQAKTLDGFEYVENKIDENKNLYKINYEILNSIV